MRAAGTRQTSAASSAPSVAPGEEVRMRIGIPTTAMDAISISTVTGSKRTAGLGRTTLGIRSRAATNGHGTPGASKAGTLHPGKTGTDAQACAKCTRRSVAGTTWRKRPTANGFAGLAANASSTSMAARTHGARTPCSPRQAPSRTSTGGAQVRRCRARSATWNRAGSGNGIARAETHGRPRDGSHGAGRQGSNGAGRPRIDGVGRRGVLPTRAGRGTPGRRLWRGPWCRRGGRGLLHLAKATARPRRKVSRSGAPSRRGKPRQRSRLRLQPQLPQVPQPRRRRRLHTSRHSARRSDRQPQSRHRPREAG